MTSRPMLSVSQKEHVSLEATAIYNICRVNYEW